MEDNNAVEEAGPWKCLINFVLRYPGHFRLMFRNDLVDRRDPRLAAASKTPGMRLGRAVLAYRGKADVDPKSFNNAADMLCGLATLHGLANTEAAPYSKVDRSLLERVFILRCVGS